MSLEELNGYFETAKAAALAAGEVIKEAFQLKKEIKTKDCFADLVTETDEKVEKLVISTLQAAYPNHKFIGEESVAGGLKINLSDDPTWIIDPVDGTTNFVHKFPYVAISIGLVINKQATIGIVYNPITGDLYTSIRGHGAFYNGQQIHANKTEDLSQALVVAEFGSSRDPVIMDKRITSMHRVIMKAHGIRCLGSAALNLCLVASGKADAYFEGGPHCWDFAAGIVIAEEAGAVVHDTNGGPFDILGRQILCATTENLAQQIASLIDEFRHERE